MRDPEQAKELIGVLWLGHKAREAGGLAHAREMLAEQISLKEPYLRHQICSQIKHKLRNALNGLKGVKGAANKFRYRCQGATRVYVAPDVSQTLQVWAVPQCHNKI